MEVSVGQKVKKDHSSSKLKEKKEKKKKKWDRKLLLGVEINSVSQHTG